MLAHATPSCVCKLSRPPLSSTRQDLKEIDPAHPARVRYSAGQALPPAMLPVSGQAPLKIHSHITASATPAAHFKRLYRNCPGTVPRPIRRFSWGSHDRVLTYFGRIGSRPTRRLRSPSSKNLGLQGVVAMRGANTPVFAHRVNRQSGVRSASINFD